MYEMLISEEIKAIYTPRRGDKSTGCKDTMEIEFFIAGVEVRQPDLYRALLKKHEHECWKDLQDMIMQAEEAAKLDDELLLDPVEWI